jgi:ketosteroid isomerase-like protein
MIKRLLLLVSFSFLVSIPIYGQAGGGSQITSDKTTRKRTTQGTGDQNAQQGAAKKAGPGGVGQAGVIAAFDALINGIQHADVNAVTSVYWNSPALILFNNNGTVTKGWEQVRKNRESSYPQLKNVKIDIRDRRVEMLGPTHALLTCLWKQSDTVQGKPETASGRMTIIFRRIGGEWKAIHLHTSHDKATDSQQEQDASPSPTPAPSTSPTPKDAKP